MAAPQRWQAISPDRPHPMSIQYIIEHPKRGVFTGFDWGRTSGAWTPHFRWSIARSEGEMFYSLERAIEERDKILAAIGLRAPLVIIKITFDAKGILRYEEVP